MANPVHDGVILIVYLSIIFTIFLVLSGPFEDTVANFADANMDKSDSEVDAAVNTARLVFDMVIAALAITPVLWFIVRMMKREPDRGYRM